MAIDLAANTAGTKAKPITEWRVVFVLPPFGVYTILGDAVAKATEQGMDPTLCIIPSPAAITSDGEMELIYR